ncbi:dienelactone hydrolase family protein [Engelhardtia mirabilis]|uniref:Carboxymethylenebutenolidase n=1 Tax=Engelhardtia mirabilis TaxID=2528011 RepID=A0A518BF43_9BACT|nr:Carboxymethylenebutenolidase [Planctomycetes bacterium Pla133]QDU99932.1 Carboxymethylenebutenolidase [Planctomycetes bacterium Pla86]
MTPRLHPRRLRPLALASVALLAACASSGGGSSSPVDMLGSLDQDTFMAMHELSEAEVPELHGAVQRVEVPGYGEMVGYLSLPSGVEGPLPGVIVIHEWWGLNDHIKLWTDRLAQEGYAALAVDLYGGTVATTREGAMEAMQSVDGAKASATLLAARDWLQREYGTLATPTASIGWCFGGGWSMQLALMDPELDGAVVYYGRTEVTEPQAERIHARILGVFGNQDQGITPEYVDGLDATLTAAGAAHEFLRYDADHAFANPSSARYDHKAAGEAWERTRAFLAEVLGAR